MAIVNVNEGVAQLRAGNIVAIPTETVYGLAGRIDDDSALKQIFATKQRPFFDPLIVHVADITQARRLAREWPEIFDILAEAFWPGPLTLIAPKTEIVSSLITSGLDSVAIRCPRHPIALQVLRELQIPLAAPSANRFGRTSPTRAEHVDAEFGGTVPVIDGGPSEVGVESTVISVESLAESKWRVHILRPGGISRSDLTSVLQARKFDFEIVRSSGGAAPGQLKTHYQPSCPVVIVERQEWSDALKGVIQERLGQSFNHFHLLPLGSSPHLAARQLYENFREFASHPQSCIVALKTNANTDESWEAIWDRIDRASSLVLN